MENEAQQNQCIRCGQRIEPGADNCPYCGAGQKEGIPPLPGTEAAGIVEKKKRPTAAIVVGIIMLLAFLLFGFQAVGMQGLKMVLTSDNPDLADTKEQMLAGFEKNPALGGMSEEELVSFADAQTPWLAVFAVGSLVFGIALFWGKKWAARGAAAVCLLVVVRSAWQMGDFGPMAIVGAIPLLVIAIYLIVVDRIFL